MNEILDILSPYTVGEDKITITVDPSSLPLQIRRDITLLFDYSAASPYGVVLPLDLTVQPGTTDAAGFQSVRFERFAPSSYTFQVPAAGEYLVLLKEAGHNFWQGRLLLSVAGDSFDLRS